MGGKIKEGTKGRIKEKIKRYENKSIARINTSTRSYQMTPGLFKHDADEANDIRVGRYMGKIKSSSGWLVGNGT